MLSVTMHKCPQTNENVKTAKEKEADKEELDH
jgi:hypothetical protein